MWSPLEFYGVLVTYGITALLAFMTIFLIFWFVFALLEFIVKTIETTFFKD